MCLDEVRALGLGDARYDADGFHLLVGRAPEWNLSFQLESSYSAFRASTSGDRLAYLRRALQSLGETSIPKSFSETLPNLVPRVRERAVYDAIWYRQTLDHEPRTPMAFRPLAEALENRSTGEVYSLSQWTMGVPTLLPRADYVVLLELGKRKPGRLIGVPWDDFVAAASSSIETTDHYPPLFRVPEQLPARLLDELQRRSVHERLGLGPAPSEPPRRSWWRRS